MRSTESKEKRRSSSWFRPSKLYLVRDQWCLLLLKPPDWKFSVKNFDVSFKEIAVDLTTLCSWLELTNRLNREPIFFGKFFGRKIRFSDSNFRFSLANPRLYNMFNFRCLKYLYWFLIVLCTSTHVSITLRLFLLRIMGWFFHKKDCDPVNFHEKYLKRVSLSIIYHYQP